MRQVELSAGSIEYEDTGGSGPVLVFTHGLIMDGSEWSEVVDDLRGDYRCVLPTLPLGAHRFPMGADADLSMRGIASLIAELLERLDLRDVTLLVNDWGGPLLVAGDERIARLVITSCEAFDNVPPGLPGRTAALAAWMPGGVRAALLQLRVAALRRLPTHLGWMTKRGVDGLIERWTEPGLRERGVRRDLGRYARSGRHARRDLTAACERLGTFDRPALVAWAAGDRVMPPEHGRRLAAILPNARHVEIADSYTLIPLDQPAALVRAVRAFLEDEPRAAAA